MDGTEVDSEGLERLSQALSNYVNENELHNLELNRILRELESADLGDSQLPVFIEQLGGSVQIINAQAEECGRRVPLFQKMQDAIHSLKGPSDTPRFNGGDQYSGRSARVNQRRPFRNG